MLCDCSPCPKETPAMMMPIAEMREFAGFAPCEQRYIKRSLDIGLARTDACAR